MTILSLRTSTQVAATDALKRAITVEIAAPRIPRAGKGPNPKISIGSIMKFIITATTIIALGVFVSPVALIALLPTIGISTKNMP